MVSLLLFQERRLRCETLNWIHVCLVNLCMCPQVLAQCLVESRCSINITNQHQAKKWEEKYSRQKG